MKVLVTGGSGFIGTYCIRQLQDQGHKVRTTVRSLDRPVPPHVEAVVADLAHDAGWQSAVQGCDYVLHVASPFPASVPKHEDDLIVPAREGTLRVLRAARDSGTVRRVVVTSSFAAIGYGHPARPGHVFTEADWTDPTADVSAYVKSKTLAERAAWDFIAKQGGDLELAVVNPVAVLGPVFSKDYASSIGLIKRMLDGGMPGCPPLWFGVVDVRDVADLHLRAMVDPKAKGERFLCAAEFLSVMDVARVLKRGLPAADSVKVPTRNLPAWIVRLGAIFNKDARQVVPELGKVKQASNAKARQLLGWQPRSAEEAILATALSLKQLQ
ncbi:dihydroflavonol-4-reductase [Bryobacterales bacterium F-183]|nr:dihydroflavonol-4-reductase [Bryobacterales bacterium F-183]